MICKRLFSGESGCAIRGPKLSMIAAVDDRMGLASGGRIPWDVAGDRQFFRARTMGQSLIMGRRTFESLGGRVLDGRYCAVLSHGVVPVPEAWPSGTIFVARDLSSALVWCAARSDVVYVAGGGAVYCQAMMLADEIWLSRIGGDYRCDLFFPEIPQDFRRVGTEAHDGFDVEHWERCFSD